jgi:tetratricopeptide (TPR) repeat protein
MVQAAGIILLAAALQSYDGALKDGNVHYDRKEWEKALDSYRKALKADPKSIEAQALIGSTLGQMRRIEEASEALHKVMDMDGRKSHWTIYASKELGITLGIAGRYEESIKAFQEGLRVDPKNELCLRNIGISYRQLGRIEEAVSFWEACLSVNPDQPILRDDVARLKKEFVEKPPLRRRPPNPLRSPVLPRSPSGARRRARTFRTPRSAGGFSAPTNRCSWFPCPPSANWPTSTR